MTYCCFGMQARIKNLKNTKNTKRKFCYRQQLILLLTRVTRHFCDGSVCSSSLCYLGPTCQKERILESCCQINERKNNCSNAETSAAHCYQQFPVQMYSEEGIVAIPRGDKSALEKQRADNFNIFLRLYSNQTANGSALSLSYKLVMPNT